MTDAKNTRVPTVWLTRDECGNLRHLRQKNRGVDPRLLVTKLLALKLQGARSEQPIFQHESPPQPLHERFPSFYLKPTVLMFMRDVWGPFEPAIETTSMNSAAQGVKPYWGFIHSIRMTLVPHCAQDLNWNIQELLFGEKDIRQNMMKDVLKYYAKNFGEQVEFSKADTWLQHIVHTSRTELEKIGFGFKLFDIFTVMPPSKVGTRLADYLVFLGLLENKSLIKLWYDNGGKDDGMDSIVKLDRLLEARWTNSIEDSKFYELVVKADCALYVSARVPLDIPSVYHKMFASCSTLLCARLALLPNQETEFVVKQLKDFGTMFVSHIDYCRR